MNEEWEDFEGPGSMVPYRIVVCSLTTSEEPDPLSMFIIAALAIAFTAFCIWLTVRIVNRRERWAKWMLAGVVALLILYPMSRGPALWLHFTGELPDWVSELLRCVYQPINHLPRPVGDLLDPWEDLWIGPLE
jgi:hypothetical protein